MKYPADAVTHFRPDLAKKFPATTQVEMLLGGIGRAVFPDGTEQFMDQYVEPAVIYSPRLAPQALEAFCLANLAAYEAHYTKHEEAIEQYLTPAIEHFWL